MNKSAEPYLEQNTKIHYTFYVIIIDSYDEDNATIGTQEMVSLLTGYAINEWVFRSYLMYYDSVLRYATTYTIVYNDMTYEQFCFTVKKDFDVEMNEDNYIDMVTANFFGDTVFYNGLIAESMRDYHADFDDLNDTFFPAIFESFILMHTTCGSYFIDGSSNIKKLLDRVCNVYIPIVKMIDTWDCDTDGTWFLTLPNNVKVDMTKISNFPKPIEMIEWYDIVDGGYQLYHYINRICDYTGSPEDE